MFKTIALVALIAASASAAQAQTGLRAEAQIGWDHPSADVLASDPDGSVKDSAGKDGFSYGGEIGYDLPLGPAILGAYANLSGATTRECVEVFGGDEACVKAGRSINAGARVGVHLSEGVLLYVKGGYSSGRIRLSYRDPADPTYDFHWAGNSDGYHVGGGIEVDVTRTVYAKLDYVRTNYDDLDYRDGTFGLRIRPHRDVIAYGMGIRF